MSPPGDGERASGDEEPAAGIGERAASEAVARPVSRGVTARLLARYDRPGPRYTSYPTAVEFDDRVGAADYETRLAAADELGTSPLSMYVHLPFCEERCLFCGCHVIISPDKTHAVPYLSLLQREASLLAERLPHRRGLSQLHLGGGTPTYYSPQQLSELVSHLLSLFGPVEGAELAVEVDPRVTTDDHLRALADSGFNRISLGLQDLTPRVQRAIGRQQSLDLTAHVVDFARSAGFAGINVDLIYGLPFQTPKTFERTVEQVIGMGADRAAVYSFAFVPWMKAHQKRMGEGALPDRETKFQLFAIARERFLQAGYEPIGMDHFARPDDELACARVKGGLRRNFQGYAVIPASDVVGLGVSAIGDVRGAYVQNHKKLSNYERALKAGRMPVERGLARNADDELRRDVIHDLMCNFRVDIPAVEATHGIVFTETFAEDLRRLAEHEAEGLVQIGSSSVRATPTGELFVRNLAMCFDRYWREKHEGEDSSVFSRTV